MFRVTRAEEQAVRLTMRLAADGGQKTLSELALGENLPEPTVAKLLGMLRRGGVVEAVRGRHGGYTLAGTPETISAGAVIRSVCGDDMFEYQCNDIGDLDCPRMSDCGLRPVWRHLADRVSEILEQTTIADLLRREAAASRNLQELWPLTGE
ncbi:MAG TPA: Rrf2 family transcriptional regulator [Candidatus Krumholzibacteria bacterium]|nr:Rrf2 family transcriptional regulator [Candidatus Krumholzibacteria bacterium]